VAASSAMTVWIVPNWVNLVTSRPGVRTTIAAIGGEGSSRLPPKTTVAVKGIPTSFPRDV